MTELEIIKEHLKGLLSCPTDWSFIEADVELQRHLRHFWLEVARGYEVDGETRFYDKRTFDEWEDQEMLKSAVLNIRTWRAAATEQYLRLTRPLQCMKFAGEDVYAKHYPPEGHAIETIRASSARGVSLFYPNCRPKNLEFLMWAVFACCWRRLLDGGAVRLFYDANFTCGASFGRDATHICFIADSSACVCHAYPILRDHIPSGEIIYDSHLTDWYSESSRYIEEDIDESVA